MRSVSTNRRGRSRTELQGFRPVLRAWRDIITEYVKDHGYPPYFYGSFERVNAGLLSAAFWRARCANLQEFAYPRKRRPGRVDLHCHVHGVIWNIEMKMSWPDLGVTKTEEAISDKVKAKLKVAVDAAREYEVDRGERRLGLVVVVPEIPAREWNSEQKRRDAVSSFVRAMASVRPAADFVDWCVPKHHEMFPKCRGDYYEEAYFYPAIGVAGKRT